ncbi:2OG-Fe(II) oxygenase family protein [Planobispora takensis]|uniref:Prolyl 4-hydroxylase alpha subunit Fe(2+) 2OG dioxygenase domain-containing protein n=1 Tax=Planobispora takensis TaxID=1367882 RepID=A0A8J3SVE0_9ACTN|nr:2OG-Fe(II) oxygenase [Planobispora takensis]GII00050.1 hypothetical protein Pta02_20580 [Planobispora takensis]
MAALGSVIGNRAWLRRNHPFPHVVARDVFSGDFYAALDAQVAGILGRGLSETPDPGRFSRNIPGYDSYGIGFGAAAPGPVGLFLTAQWRDTICDLFGVKATPYVFAGAHHHAVGSASGFVHNDFNPVWFPRADEDAIRTPDAARCDYKTGTGPLPEEEKVQVVRGAVVLFFLRNHGWRPGDGGETGLYADARDPVDAPALRCPPVDNSLVAFECTPRSFHTYLSNTRLPRTSIIMWVHRTLDEAGRTFGTEKLERWKN